MPQKFSLRKSKQYLEAEGFKVGILEHFHFYAKRTMDFLGLADLGAVRKGYPGTLYVQSCGEDVQSHIEKMLANPHLADLIDGNTFHLHSWVMRGARGKRKVYQLRVIEFILDGSKQVVHRQIKEAPHVAVDPVA